MKEAKKYRIPGYKEYKFRQKALTFLFFLFIAFVFWLLSALNHNYSTNIRYPIRYIHYLSDKEMTHNIPNEIVLNVTAHGYTLLRSKITAHKNPIFFRVISLNFTEISRDSGKYLLLTQTLNENVQRQLGDQVTLNYISPDSLFYYFSPVVKKKVPVSPNLDIDFEKQYMHGGDMIIQPDSVIVTGPSIVLDTLSYVKTNFHKMVKVDKPFTVTLDLLESPNLRYFPKQVTIAVPVEKYTETTIMVSIKAKNVPDSFYLKTFPSAVKLNVLVSLKNYNKLSPDLFEAEVDYHSTFSNINNKLKVRIKRQPSFVKIISFSPINVEYIVER